MKKILIALLAAAMLFAFTACDDDNGPSFREVRNFSELKGAVEAGEKNIALADDIDIKENLELDVAGLTIIGNDHTMTIGSEYNGTGYVINVLAKKWQIKPHLACKKFISAFWNREVLFFTIPQTADADGLPDSQVKALQAAVPVEMSGKVYIHLQRGNPLTLNNKLLGVQDEEEDSEEEDEVENE